MPYKCTELSLTLTHSLTYSFTYSLIHLLTHSHTPHSTDEGACVIGHADHQPVAAVDAGNSQTALFTVPVTDYVCVI